LSLDEAHVLQGVSHLLGGRKDKKVFYGLEVANLTRTKSGAIYPILERLEVDSELFESEMERVAPHEKGRPARRLYKPTPLGRRVLDVFQEDSNQTKQ
jgi:DNA-binding PadR family transcriptional regulator